jgi:hypothetical protein
MPEEIVSFGFEDFWSQASKEYADVGFDNQVATASEEFKRALAEQMKSVEDTCSAVIFSMWAVGTQRHSPSLDVPISLQE